MPLSGLCSQEYTAQLEVGVSYAPGAGSAPVEPGEPVFADPRYVDAQLDIPIPSQRRSYRASRAWMWFRSETPRARVLFCRHTDKIDARQARKWVLLRSSSLHNRNRSKAGSARPGTAVRMPKWRSGCRRFGWPLSGNSCSKSLPPATPTAGRPTPVASGRSVVDGSPAVGSLSPWNCAVLGTAEPHPNQPAAGSHVHNADRRPASGALGCRTGFRSHSSRAWRHGWMTSAP